MSASPETARVRVLGAGLDRIDRAGVARHLEDCLIEGRRCFLITANVDHLVRFQEDEMLRLAYARADLVVADGVPLLWAARLLGDRLPGRAAGSDLIFDLCAAAGRCGAGVFLLGGRPGVAERAASVLVERYPGARVAGTACPPHGFERDPEAVRALVRSVRASGADLILVGLGSPKQEVFLAEHWDDLGVKVGVGIGIALEFLAGTLRRAPVWMQSAGLEWSWRLAQEPTRLWRRYLLRDPRFLLLVVREAIGRGRGVDEVKTIPAGRSRPAGAEDQARRSDRC